jgi:hypothetical protein
MPFKTCCMSLANALISAPSQLEDRRNIRKEFLDLKIVETIEVAVRAVATDMFSVLEAL